MLGIGIGIAWPRISAGDWMTYAADISRRPLRSNRARHRAGPLETETS
jgi:hypothetical protein